MEDTCHTLTFADGLKPEEASWRRHIHGNLRRLDDRGRHDQGSCLWVKKYDQDTSTASMVLSDERTVSMPQVD